jgi:signal transduction histidine kinase
MDEFAEVAREMNAMCGKLTEAQSRIQEEAGARIAALEQLRHADRLMTVGKLASGIAHELGTPLNVVSIRASMIASGDTSPEETTEYAQIIADASKRMARIIRQLLAFARRSPADKSLQDVRLLARDTLELLRPLAEKSDIRLELRCDEEDTEAKVDGGELQQALTNLVVNAIHAMPDGGRIEVTIDRDRLISAQGERPSLRVRVRDEGLGIPAEDLPHVFEPFFTTKDVGEGTGLGLSVTHGIIEDHGGRIGVESAPGIGTSFTIHLPLGDLS